MKWFKHQSDARNSLKLRKVRRKYGADGYAIYWFCLEAISYDVDKDNLTFSLREDAETIGFELSIQEKRVEEIMSYMVEINLFEQSSNLITCLKLAESIDKSMTNSPKMRAWLNKQSVMACADTVNAGDDNANTCAELELEVEVEVEKNKELIVDDKSTTAKKVSKFKFSDDDFRCAKWMLELIEKVSKPNKKPNLESWANVIRLMRESDKLDHNTIATVFNWANKDSFWCSNILSPKKLREKFQQLDAKMKGASNAANNQGNSNKPRKLGAAERIRQRNEAKYGVQPSGGFCMGENGGDIRGAVDQGEWRDSIIDVESGA